MAGTPSGLTLTFCSYREAITLSEKDDPAPFPGGGRDVIDHPPGGPDHGAREIGGSHK